MLRVLFYEDPITDQSAFLWRAPHVMLDAPWLLALLRGGCDARMLVHDRFVEIARKADVPPHVVFAVSEADLVRRLDDPQLNVNTLFQRHFDFLVSEDGPGEGAEPGLALAFKTRDALADALSPVLGDFAPDVIITWAPAPHLRRLFPSALILHKETSVFSRAPFPLTYYLDPCGFHRWSAMARPEEPARTTDVSALRALERLRAGLASAFDLTDNVVDLADRLQPGKTLLVAGHTNGVFFFDGACEFRSQSHALLAALEGVSADWTVIASEHPDCRRFTAAELDFFQGRHANFVPLPELASRPGSGQHLVRHADRVATVSSSVGLQALFWGKPLHALGQSHLNRFAATQGPLGLADTDAQNAFGDPEAAWLSFHYSYPNDKAAAHNWLADHLRGKHAHWREHGLAGYFAEPIDEPASLADEMLRPVADLLRTFWGPPLGSSDEPVLLNFDHAAYFGRGWGASAPSQFGPYRWTTESEAELRLPLAPGHDHAITIEVGTHASAEGQSATVLLGDLVVARADVSITAPGRLRIEMAAADVTQPATHLRLRSGKLEAPGLGTAPLGLISARIEIESAAVRSRRPIAPASAPRHSIVMPTLNGHETLTSLLPAMLELCSDEVEIIVSDNLSEDQTWSFLRSLDDPRLKIVQPPERLDYGRNTEFAYTHARGEWISHFGDDDQVLRSRFALIDAIASVPDVEMIFGGRLRYYWPTFIEPHLANSLDAGRFGDTALLSDGPTMARRLINSANIRHTAAVVTHRDLVDRVRRMTSGPYMVQRLGEYVAYRVAAGLARKIAFVNRPLGVIGRHTKSIGTSMHHDASAGARYGTNLEREIGSLHGRAGFDFLGQQPFSLEAAQESDDLLTPHIGATPIDYVVWRRRMRDELASKVTRGVISTEAANFITERGEAALATAIARQGEASFAFGVPQANETLWGWEERRAGADIGCSSINDVAAWFDASFAIEQSADSLRFVEVDETAVTWVDS